LLKLDFKKAYDTLEWEFVISVLKAMGFGEKWIAWIYECISTPCISILINGAPTPPFNIGRGLRQWDPLSPFLFILAAEVLNKLLENARNAGIFQGLQVGRNNVNLSHLQFADDILIMCQADKDSLCNVKKLLSSFQAASGLEVNYAKSGLLILGKDADWTMEMAQELGCSLINLLFNYLGFSLGCNMRHVSSWQPVLNKVQSRLSSWKAKAFLEQTG